MSGAQGQPGLPGLPGRAMLVLGLLIVLVDLRFNGFDIVSDPVGWVLAMVVLLGLARRHTGFAVAAASAIAGTFVSLCTVLSEPGTVLSVVEGVALTGVVFGTCTALIALALSPTDRRAADIIRWLDLGLTVLSLLAAGTAGDETVQVGGAAGLLVVIGVMAAIVTVVWFLVVVWRVELRPEPATALG
ncbi:hypothetical protein [Nocardioides sp.]|uniref:hypothetical protein n=1 Tax=Nocardioides sp. TaxID=35761 RepID=UPI002BAB3A68|nr:hypothetical protein [Nocardioides sp.]HSX66918.1 hypothetical protein [Nocardioides sp.]